MWRKILRVDLDVTESQFGECVRDKTIPARGDSAPPPTNALPINLVNPLVHEVGVPIDEVMRMNAAQAAKRLADYYSRFGQRP